MKKFLNSVGNVVAMQGNDIIFTANTLTDSGITLETSNTEVRGGIGNSLQSVYYHSGTLNITLTDVQFKLPYIAKNVGADIVNGGEIWTSESVTLAGTIGTLTGNPVAVDGESLSAWVEVDDVHYTLEVNADAKTFDVSGIPGITAGSTICVKYLDRKDAARHVIVPSNFIPDRVRLYITANLYGDTAGKGKIGNVQIEIPVAQLSGAMDLSMTADGNTTSNITAMALAYNDSNAVGCGAGSYYAKITESIDSAVWYAGVSGLAIAGGDFTMVEGTQSTMRVYAVRNGDSFLCDNSKLNFQVVSGSGATVGATTGIVNASAEGSVLIRVTIPTTSIEASATVTINAAD